MTINTQKYIKSYIIREHRYSGARKSRDACIEFLTEKTNLYYKMLHKFIKK